MENALSHNEMNKIKANFCPQWCNSLPLDPRFAGSMLANGDKNLQHSFPSEGK
jgi:hypothetical protein